MTGDDRRFKAPGQSGTVPTVGSQPSGRYTTIASSAPPSQRTRKASFTRHSFGPLRTLLVAPDNDIRRGVTRILENHEGEVHAAASFGEAFHLVETLAPTKTLLLIDPLLPGFEPRLVGMFRQHWNVAGGPAVLISAISAPVLEDVMRTTGADGFLVTTKGLLHLDTALASWLERLDLAKANTG